MADKPVLLDDATMQQFIRNGYLILKPDFPDGFHEEVYERLTEVFEKSGNPGNNLLPAVPQLQDVWGHPVVHGAFCSILGSDYYLHLHRHDHESPPGNTDQNMHKDSLGNSRYCADHNRRHHHTRWMMAFYYPQDTPPELGPTAIIPKSQYLVKDNPSEEEVFTDGQAGTICLVHYDMRHRRVRNDMDMTRHMVKFLFTRMSEPTEPTWDHKDATWEASDDPQEAIWQYMWNWHRGVVPKFEPLSDSEIEELSDRVADEDEAKALDAVYRLGSGGAVSALVDGLKNPVDETPARNVAYGFNAAGESAVPEVLELAKHEDAQIRARAVDVLGDMGLSAKFSVPDLVALLDDEDEDVRARAAESLGTCGLGQSDFVTKLADILVHDESDQVRRNTTLTLARLGPCAEDAIPELGQAMRDENHYVRGFSVHALYRIGTPEAMRTALEKLQLTRWDANPRGVDRKRNKPHQKEAAD